MAVISVIVIFLGWSNVLYLLLYRRGFINNISLWKRWNSVKHTSVFILSEGGILCWNVKVKINKWFINWSHLTIPLTLFTTFLIVEFPTRHFIKCKQLIVCHMVLLSLIWKYWLRVYHLKKVFCCYIIRGSNYIQYILHLQTYLLQFFFFFFDESKGAYN